MKLALNEAQPATDEVRVESLHGDPHLVAPVVMVREGVLNGQFLSFEEIERSVPGWNGRPITAPPEAGSSGHPMDGDDFISANQAEVLDRMKVGQVLEAEARTDLDDSDGKSPKGLAGETWTNLRRVKEVGELAVEAARRMAEAEALDVSTAYFHAEADASGTFNDDRYTAEQFDLMPDHLALLPNEKGACSWPDGCGAPRSNTAAVDAMQVNEALGSRVLAVNEAAREDLYLGGINANAAPRTPEYDGLSSAEDLSDWSTVGLTFETFVDNYATDNPDATEWGDLSDAERSRIAARSLNGDPEADTFAEGVTLPVVNPETDDLAEVGLDAALSRAGTTEGINETETQNKARRLLNEQFDRNLELEENMRNDDPKSVLSRIRSLVSANDAGAGCGCGDHGQTMDENKIEALAESTAFDLETLKEWDDERLTSLAETLDTFESDGDGDGGADDGGDGAQNTGGDASEEVEALRETVSELTDTVDELRQAQNRDPEAEAAREFLTEHTDMGEETLAETPDPAVKELAQNHGFGTQYAEPAGNRVNRLGQAGGSASANGQDADEVEEMTANVGALATLDGEGED